MHIFLHQTDNQRNKKTAQLNKSDVLISLYYINLDPPSTPTTTKGYCIKKKEKSS